MISFSICLFILILAFFTYGKYVDKAFKINDRRSVPSIKLADGVDYIPMPLWKSFIIQFLNIAGIGPIFGAILGAKFGCACFFWIVFGCIFGGAVHDHISGMLAVRMNGASLPEIIGRYLGPIAKYAMRILAVILMVLVGAVFVSSPAGLLANLSPNYLDLKFWIIVIFIYYLSSTILPFDKIIGKIYPIFGFALLFMAIGILVSLYFHASEMPELWTQGSLTPLNGKDIFPLMFVTIACGAVSGFHATQSSMIARCLKSEHEAYPVFYGSMITEGIVALIWAAAATIFFHSDPANLAESNAAVIVNSITRDWLGSFGAILAILGVVAAPITTGDTAFRSARLIVADIFKIDQKNLLKRFAMSLPIFLAGILVLVYSMTDSEGFQRIWNYFSWANQTLAAVTLWAITVHMYVTGKNYFITIIPAIFMTEVSGMFIFYAQESFGMSYIISLIISTLITLLAIINFYAFTNKWKRYGSAILRL